MKTILEYLYTGKATFTNSITAEVIEVTDAAEQYGLKTLKESCGSILWDHAAEFPEKCFHIARMTDLHDEMKYVKHRALEVLADNFEQLELQSKKLEEKKFGDDDRGKRLKEEILLYCHRRKDAYLTKK